MSFTASEKHWLWGCAVATAASRSDVNVAMPHLRGTWSPTNAILRILETSFMGQSFIPRTPRCYAHESARHLQMYRLSVKWEGTFSGSVDSVLRAVISRHAVYLSDAGWQERGKDIRADAVIVSMSPPSYPSVWLHPCRARCCSTWLNHCTSHRDWRSDFVMAYLRTCRWCSAFFHTA